MDLLKKYFPYSFGVNDVAALVIKIIVYLVAPVVLGIVLGIVGALNIGIINWLLGILETVIGLYCLIGIVLSVLDFLKVLK